MAIDTNLGIIYNEHYPVAGVDQSSQGFRDNFSVLKRAIENLHSASASGSSIFSIASTIGTGGVVRVTVGFKDNAFRLPTGNPTGTPQQGMVRYSGPTFQFHDGSAWQSFVSTDLQGGVRIPGSAYLKLPSGFTNERPATGEDGMLRYNNSLGAVEVFRLGEWVDVASGGSSGGINSTGGTISGVLDLLTDATLPTHAVNFRTMKSYATGMFVSRSKGISAGFNQVSNTAELTAMPFTVELSGAVVGSGTITDLNDVVIETAIPNQLDLQDVRDEVGNFVRGTVRDPQANTATETGITVNYDATNNTLELGVREFDITLTGAVTGTGHSARLNDIIIQTESDRIRGVTAYDEGIVLGAEQTVQNFNFVGGGITATQTGNTVDVVVSAGLTRADVRDEVGSFVHGTIRDPQSLEETETGIFVNYDENNNRLELLPRDFTVSLSGAVNGSTTISRLGNAIIETTTDRIRGIQVLDENIAAGYPESVQALNFTGAGISVTQTANVATINVPQGLTLEDVRDHVGTFVTGTIRDPQNLGSFTESGIFVNYDEENNKLEIAPRDFNITLTGAVTGSTTISRLGNATINTLTDRVRGIRVFDEGGALGAPESIQNLNFIGNAISVLQTGNTATITVNDGLNNQDVRNVVGGFVKGTVRTGNATTTESGITVNYDSENLTLELGVRDFSIGLTGAVNGSAVVSRLGNVSITTTTDRIRGVEVKDEGVPTGGIDSVKTFNFTGGGIAVTQLGSEVTVDVPVGLTPSDVRSTVGSFVKGTIRNPDNQTVSESGITVFHDSENNTLEVGARDFTISLAGAVTGEGTVSRLGNVSITTTTDLIKGLRFYNEGSATGLVESVRQVNFIGNGINVTQLGDTATVTVNDGLSLSQVRDEVGRIVIGQDGIITTYDSENETIRVAPRSFSINLSGDISGSGTVNNLGNVTITTSAPNLIEGLTVQDEGVQQGANEAIKTIDFVGSGISVVTAGDKATVTVPQGLTSADVRNTVGTFVAGTQRVGNAVTESGITVYHDVGNNTLELGVRDFTVGLVGAVTGSGVVSRLGNVSITTTTDLVKGLRFYDEGSALGLPESVREVNFTGGGVSVTQTGNSATVTISEGLSLANVRDEIGAVVQGNNGLITTYNAENQSLTVSPRDFNIALSGAVSGNATVTNLGNVVITTTSSAISGMTVQDEGSTLGSIASVTSLNFTGSGVAASRVGNSVTVNVPEGLTSSDVRNTVGTFVTGTQRLGPNSVTESGVTVFHDTSNNTLEIGVRDFVIDIAGAVTGNAVVSRLGNVTINTTTDLIRGLTVEDEGLTLGTPQSVRKINFVGGGVTVLQSSDLLTVDIPTPLSNQDVIQTVGSVVQGTVRDPGTNISTESGIIVNYDAENDVVEVSPREFNITLAGAITGTGKVSRLSNVTINTTADFLKGIRLQKDGTLLGTTVKTINVLGGNASVTGDTATISLVSQVSQDDIRNTVNSLLVGNHHVGLSATYDTPNSEIDIALNPLNVTLLGAVTGNASVVYGTNTSELVISTTMNEVGIEVRDEGTTSGTVKAVNFVGGGISTAVSIDGEVATVYVPNSPANENFILVDHGSANVPNARKLTAGTGILIDDGGPGGAYTISAHNDAIIAKSRFMSEGVLVSERPQINILGSNEIIPEVIDDEANGQINIRYYSIDDGWHRSNTIECGLISDKYGPSIDLGTLARGIIETDADMGTL